MKSRNFAIVLVLVAVLMATPLTALVQAEPKVVITRRSFVVSGVTYSYTQTKIALGGANSWIKIPDTWNGRLVVLCRGYSHVLDPNAIPLDAQSLGFLSMGAATAASNYGEGGYSVKEGIIRTHQLTEYVIDNYGVTGYVYLFGASMGGNIVLELGAKYPNLYDGVFDLFGSKNLKTQFADKMVYANLTDDTALQNSLLAHGSAIPPVPFTAPLVPLPLRNQLNAFRNFSINSGTDIWLACGMNTPEEKPQAYERISPTFSAVDIAVPTITLHGTADGLVPYSQSIEFMNAVNAAGNSDLYRLYKVVGAGHGDITSAQISLPFSRLVAWVENKVIPPPSTP